MNYQVAALLCPVATLLLILALSAWDRHVARRPAQPVPPPAGRAFRSRPARSARWRNGW